MLDFTANYEYRSNLQKKIILKDNIKDNDKISLVKTDDRSVKTTSCFRKVEHYCKRKSFRTVCF